MTALAGVLVTAARQWSADQVSRLAASLAYYTLFSVAPAVLLTVAVLRVFLGESEAQGLVATQLREFLGPERTRELQQVLAVSRRPAAGGGAGVVGFVVLLMGASGVVGELQASLNQIFRARSPRQGVWAAVRRRLVSMAFVMGMGLLLVASLAINAVTAAAAKYLGEVVGARAQALQAANQLASFAVLTGVFAALFRYLPDARLGWRDVLVGAMFTAGLFTAGNLLLGLYLGRAGPASAYGAAGSLLAFLLWTYYCAQMVYFGAEFTRAAASRAAR